MLEKKRVEAQYKELSLKLEAVFFEYDPIGINFGSNTDEYCLEVSRVLSNLPSAKSEEEVHTIVYKVFCTLFNTHLAGEKQSTAYQNIAKETWLLWCEYSRKYTV